MQILKDRQLHYKCTNCGKSFSQSGVIYLCPECAKLNTPNLPPKGVLKVEYDYVEIIKKWRTFHDIAQWDFLPIMPYHDTDSLPWLKVGKTPFYTITKLNGQKLPFKIHLKDDSQNPTFSFKDRASAAVSAFAREQGINTIVAASTGNAGSSLAGICASQGQQAIIMVPEKAPAAKLTQIVMYGATIIPVKGTYDQAFDLSVEATRAFGWYNRNTAFNPLTIEGKKTVSLELFEQLGQTIPDRIFVPVGDGVIISGVYKGFEDLWRLGVIERIPTVVAVQAKGSRNLVSNMGSEPFTITPSTTMADSISVDIPRNFYMAKQFLKMYAGETILVSDEEIVAASSILAKNTGIFTEPAAATAFAGLLAYQKNDIPGKDSNNVVLLTGSGLKDLKGVASIVRIPESIEANLSALVERLKI